MLGARVINPDRSWKQDGNGLTAFGLTRNTAEGDQPGRPLGVGQEHPGRGFEYREHFLQLAHAYGGAAGNRARSFRLLRLLGRIGDGFSPLRGQFRLKGKSSPAQPAPRRDGLCCLPMPVRDVRRRAARRLAGRGCDGTLRVLRIPSEVSRPRLWPDDASSTEPPPGSQRPGRRGLGWHAGASMADIHRGLQAFAGLERRLETRNLAGRHFCGRLRPPPDRTGRHALGGARNVPQTAIMVRFPASPGFANRRLLDEFAASLQNADQGGGGRIFRAREPAAARRGDGGRIWPADGWR